MVTPKRHPLEEGQTRRAIRIFLPREAWKVSDWLVGTSEEYSPGISAVSYGEIAMKVLFTLMTILALSVFASTAVATHVSKPVMTMDKTGYKAGEAVTVKGWVEYSNNPTSDVLLDIIVRTPTGNEIVRGSVRSDADGNFIFHFMPPADASPGTYIVKVISQCRNEHRSICTNQSASVELTVER